MATNPRGCTENMAASEEGEVAITLRQVLTRGALTLGGRGCTCKSVESVFLRVVV